VAKFAKPGVYEKISEGEVPLFCRYLNFLKTQCRTGRKKVSMPKTRLIRSFLLSEHRRTQTDRQTDRQTQTYTDGQTDRQTDRQTDIALVGALA